MLKKRIGWCILVICLLCLGGCGCNLDGRTSGTDELMVMTYNVQNLFDAYVTGNEYPEYTPEKGWTVDQYKTRLRRTAQAITQGHNTVPDIVVLQEIEHVGVLEDLLQESLCARGFQWYACTNDPSSAIQTGVMSRFPIIEARIHGVQNLRSVLEVTIDVGHEELVLFALHAKSRKEGIEETEAQRIATAKVVSTRAQELLHGNPFLAIMVAGDFNQSADSFQREGQVYQTALVPLEARQADEYAATGSLLVGGFPVTQGWYTWWLDRKVVLLAQAQGSYYYNGVWESFDQILLSPAFFDGYGVEYKTGQVGAGNFLCDAQGHPATWNIRTGKGVSDHLPVYVILTGR